MMHSELQHDKKMNVRNKIKAVPNTFRKALNIFQILVLLLCACHCESKLRGIHSAESSLSQDEMDVSYRTHDYESYTENRSSDMLTDQEDKMVMALSDENDTEKVKKALKKILVATIGKIIRRNIPCIKNCDVTIRT